MIVDLRKQKRGLLCGEIAFRGLLGQTTDDLLITAKLIVNLFVALEDVFVSLELELLHFLASQSSGVVLHTLNSSVNFSL
jgi:hypothetical protein